MKALTLWQPWASLIAWGEKRYETRSYGISHRGTLAIHAGLMSDIQHREPAPFVCERLPNATVEELAEAQGHYEGFLDALIRIYRRLDEAGYFECTRDKSPDRASLEKQHDA